MVPTTVTEPFGSAYIAGHVSHPPQHGSTFAAPYAPMFGHARAIIPSTAWTKTFSGKVLTSGIGETRQRGSQLKSTWDLLESS